MIAILTGMVTFLLWPAMVSVFSDVFWPFGLLPLKKFCLAQLPIYLLAHRFLGGLVF
jgi:hypothetical protein